MIGWIGFRCRYSPPGSNAAEGRKAEASSDKPDPFEHFFCFAFYGEPQPPVSANVTTLAVTASAAMPAFNRERIFEAAGCDCLWTHKLPSRQPFVASLSREDASRVRRSAGQVDHCHRNQLRWRLGSFVFSHARVRPLTYPDPIRLETMPSKPKPQA